MIYIAAWIVCGICSYFITLSNFEALCGPEGFVKTMLKALSEDGENEHKLYSDGFNNAFVKTTLLVLNLLFWPYWLVMSTYDRIKGGKK